MFKLKRVVSFAVTCMLTVGIMHTGFAAKLPQDVQGTKYEDSVALLQALKIMVGDKDTGNFRLEDGIIRSEVAKIAVTMAGLAEVAESSTDKTPFPDVVKGHWATGYINVAASQKFVIGDDYGNFRPDDKITFAEAATILTRVLGYEPSAKANGGFPTGYLVVAGQNGLLDGGANASANTQATRGIVALMSYNGLTIDLMERTGYGTDEQYEVVDKTLLFDKLDVTKEFGQVIANNESTLTGSSTLKEDEVQINVNGTIDTYKTNGTDAKNFLGRNVVSYVQENDITKDKNLVLVTDDSNKNDDVAIDAKNINTIIGNAGSDKTLTYWINKETDKKPEEATIASDAKIFYNGVATTYDLADLANLTSGSVKLLDTNRSDKYNFVFITEYQNMVVEDVSLTSFRVNDKNNLLSLTLDPKDKNIIFSITKDGEKIGLDQINEWDVLSVAMDKKSVADAKVINVYVSNKTVSGKVTEIADGKYTIGDNQYKVAANYVAANQPEIKLNDEGTFYLDIENKIAAVDTTTRAGSNYAYLVNADTTNTINNKLELKLFTKDGETVILNGADKMKVNNQTSLTADQAKAAIANANNGSMAQLITYELNSKGEVYYVNTAAVNEASGTAIKSLFSLDFKSTSDGVQYTAASKKLGNLNVNDSTIVLDIPTGKTDTEDFAVRNLGMFVDKSKYEVEIYDLSEDLTAKVVIVKNSKGEVNVEAPVAVVDKISDTQNADAITVNKLYAIQDGVKVEKLAKDTETLVKNGGTKLQPGDVIQYQTNARGEIDKVTVLFDSADRNTTTKDVYTKYEGTEMETILGTVSKKFATSINVKASNMAETNLDISNAKVYSYDSTKSYGSQVSIVDASSITRYDSVNPEKVFIRIFKGEVKEIVIINQK